jgi:hypothetical protein
MGNIRPRPAGLGTGCRHEGLVAQLHCVSLHMRTERSREYPVGGAVTHTAKEYTSDGE